MEENTQHKMTVVSYPDYHVDPGATHILVVGDFKFQEQAQDAIGIHWPDADVTLYRGDAAIPNVQSAIEHHTWLYYQFKMAKIVIVTTKSWKWVWPVLATIDGEIFFVDDQSDSLFLRTLNLTYPGRVFHTAEQAVKAVVSTRL